MYTTLHKHLRKSPPRFSLPRRSQEIKNAIFDMNGHRDYHAERSKSEREKQISYDTTSMWNLKNETNESIYIDSQTQKTNKLPKGKGTGEGNKLGLWD